MKTAKTAGLAVENWPIDRPKPYERNPRRNESAVAKVAASIREFGFRQPLVVDGKGVIVAGHTRLLAARSLGLKEVPVHVAKLTEAQVRAYRLADNRVGQDAEWDNDLLAGELKELQGEGFDLALTGFEVGELAGLLGSTVTVEDADAQEVPEPPANPVTMPGDLITLGRHRLLCGDATKAEDVARLMGEERAGLMNTDPPYGVSYANADRPNPGVAALLGARPPIAGDQLRDEELQAFLTSAFRVAAAAALTSNAAWYLWHADLTQGFFAAAAAAAANVVLSRQIIWVKPHLLLTRGQYHWKHEPCFFGWVQGHQPPDYGRGNGERNQTTVWEVGGVGNAERADFGHATPKPVGLFDGPIVKHLKAGEIAYEPFAGSGPQFIAAEITGRRCFGIEIDQRYCDVICQRWETLTGQKAVRP